jgi:hypothetical protein
MFVSNYRKTNESKSLKKISKAAQNVIHYLGDLIVRFETPNLAAHCVLVYSAEHKTFIHKLVCV